MSQASQDEKKRTVARAALERVPPGSVVGVGTGSTANHFIDALAQEKGRFDGAIASSEASAKRLREHGVELRDPNETGPIEVYVDGADEATRHLHLTKGGGGALTREKIVAAIARHFVCVVDDSKLVDRLGGFPLPVEVLPMARSHVARELARLGGRVALRTGFTTDNGNLILDVHGLDIVDPPALESELNQLTGVVANGLFARRGADVLLVGTGHGVEVIE